MTYKLSDAIKKAQDDAFDDEGKLFSAYLSRNPEYYKYTNADGSFDNLNADNKKSFADFYNDTFSKTDPKEYLTEEFHTKHPFYEDFTDENSLAAIKDSPDFIKWIKRMYNGNIDFLPEDGPAPKKNNMLEARDEKKEFLKKQLEDFINPGGRQLKTKLLLDDMTDEQKHALSDWLTDGSTTGSYKARTKFVQQLLEKDPGFIRKAYDDFFKGRYDKDDTAKMEDVSEFIKDLYGKHGMPLFNRLVGDADITDMTNGSDTKKFATLMNDKGEKFKLLPEQVVRDEAGNTDFDATFRNIADTLANLK